MKPACSAALTVVLAAFAAPPAPAIDFHWTGGGADNNWHNPLNWDPGTTSTSWPDGTNDAAIFDRLITAYTVDFDFDHDNERFEVRTGHPSIFLYSGVTLHDYTLHTTTEPAAIISTFPGALFDVQATINGRINENGITAVNTSQILQIAVGATNTKGTLNLNDVHWSSSAASFVGLNGNGTLNMNPGAIMTSSNGVLGFSSGATGTATISGEWENTVGDLVVGRSGAGTLNLNSSAFAHTTAGPIAIAQNPGSVGTVNVAGTSKLQSAGSLYVGGGPGGTGGNGTLTVTSAGPSFDVQIGDDLIVYANGTVNINNGSNVYVENDLVLNNGAQLHLNSGELITETLTGPANSVTWTSGHLFVQNGVVIDANAPLGASQTLNANKLLETDLLQVGPTAGGTLTINNTDATGSFTEVGSLTPGTDPATLTLSGANAKLNTISLDVRGATQATMNVQNGAKVAHLFSASRIAGPAGTHADVNIMNPGTNWTSDAPLYIGGDATTAGGTATVDITDEAQLIANALLKLWPGATMTVDNGTLTFKTLDVAGSLTFQNNALFNTSPTTDVTVSGSLSIGTGIVFNFDELTVTEGGHVAFANQFVTVDPLNTGVNYFNRLRLEGGTLTVPVRIEFVSETLFGRGKIDGIVWADKGVSANGDLTLGRADAVNAVRISEDFTFTVGAHHVTLLEKNFWDMHAFTRVTGGTLSVPNGITMRSGLFFSAFGTVDGRMFVHGGSTIEADGGDLTLGDASSLAGFFSDGELYTKANTVTLLDANEAVLGSLTVLGDTSSPGNPGTLTAPNGFLLEQGKNVTGYGVINGNFINQGYVEGVGPESADAIEFTGDVSGIGDYGGNIIFSGDFSPGNSPGEVTVDGNLMFGDSARLQIELGGLIPGSEHDRVVVAGDFFADGILEIALINGFAPQAGDAFNLFAFADATGTFDRIDLPTLNDGLRFDTSSLLTTGRLLVVVPEPASAVLMGLGGLALAATRRR